MAERVDDLRSSPGEGQGPRQTAEDARAEDAVPEPIPEADSDATADAWEESEAMEGEAPTG